MAKKKIIPTWVKLAAAAALFVPYKIDLDRDENKKIKRVTANSVAFRLSFSPATETDESDFSAVIPGIGASAKLKAGAKTYTVDSEQIMHSAKAACGEVADKVKKLAKKAADGFVTVNDEEN